MQKTRLSFLARATMTLLLAMLISIGAWATPSGNWIDHRAATASLAQMDLYGSPAALTIMMATIKLD